MSNQREERSGNLTLPIFLLASCLAGTACGDVVQDATWVVQDSAGVEVVVSHAPASSNGGGWVVADEPRLEIGLADGPRELLFDGVVDVVQVDGTVIVADGGTNELRFFGPDGRYLRSVGGTGEGPGEYRGIQRIGLWKGDSLFVFDHRLNRVSVLNEHGGFARSWSTAGTAVRLGDLQPLVEPEWVGVDGSTLQVGAPGTVARDTAHFFVMGASADGLDTLGAVPGERTFTFSIDGQEGYRFAPLTPSPAWDVAGGRLYVTAGDAFEARVLDRSGGLVRIMRRSSAPAEATDEDMAAWRDEVLAAVPEPARPQFESLLSQFPRPAHVPVYRTLLVDPLGTVWMERYQVPFGASGRWDTYDRAGRFYGTVQVPPQFEVFDITEHEVLGVWIDESGVESVRVYELDRSGE